MNMFASVRYHSSLVVLALTIFLADGQNASAIIVVDFSPDTTDAPLLIGTRENQHLQQIVGDRFMLSEDTNLTGGSIFSDNLFGNVGDAVRFLVFADPLAAPIINIGTTLNAVDTLFTTTNATSGSPLTRKHATIAPTLLLAGTYWFSMPGDGLDIRQGTTTVAGGYDDGGFRNGSTNLAGTTASGGDMYFQLEAVPEPSCLILGAIGVLSLLGLRRRATHR